MLTIIVATDEGRGIGLNNRLPWTLKADLKEFRKITMGHGVLMGRKTLDSIGKALDGRTNYVVTHQPSLPYEKVVLVHDLIAFLKEKQASSDVVYVIGGASLYRSALPYVNELIISRVKGIHTCDTFFPDYDEKDFVLTASVDFEGFTQVRYQRIRG